MPAPIRTTDELVRSALAAQVVGRRTVLGVVGPPGAGKTHVASYLTTRLGEAGRPAALVQMDGFHLANDVLVRLGRRARKGAPDTFDVGGFVALLDRLRVADASPVYAPRFLREWEEAISAAVEIEAAVRVVVVEGNYLLVGEGPWRDVAGRLDACFYLEVPAAVRDERLRRRHSQTYGDEAAARAWIDAVDRPNAAIVERWRSGADLVVADFAVPGSALL